MSAPTLNDLTELPVWLAWQGEPAKPGASPRKVHYAARNSARRGSSTDRETWGPRQAATARVAGALPKPCGIGGLGIVLTALDAETALCGIDLDTRRGKGWG
jgi:primase-polymerase (primpol)-like protein